MPARLTADHVEISTSRPRTVLDLPPEIILYIANFLPTTSTALFALCNKTSASQLRSSHNAADKDCACMGVHQCASCPVEYQIDIVDLGKKGTAFCTTKWLSFGAGNSTTDSKWSGHTRQLEYCCPHDLPLGSIRSSYESQEGPSLEDITAENKKRLSSCLRVVRNRVYTSPNGYDWKLVGQHIWYFRPLGGTNTIAAALSRWHASNSRTIVQILEVLFLILVLAVWVVAVVRAREMYRNIVGHSGL
ncbi:hypothetical protein L207DRAFT_429028 [Hyaloscypha variabilis F]|uniref:F-box domain-containing protein n=1 Tax=Hyaloscypha variabilis (strain UAMH 11265 / GT02V1 / F) TaxID=1149755 RepID=A0A2J6RMD3_HYAVF|nr:hypothetical protein L207DRAFT_429028 [Hyaloscypha variabilis F]